MNKLITINAIDNAYFKHSHNLTIDAAKNLLADLSAQCLPNNLYEQIKQEAAQFYGVKRTGRQSSYAAIVLSRANPYAPIPSEYCYYKSEREWTASDYIAEARDFELAALSPSARKAIEPALKQKVLAYIANHKVVAKVASIIPRGFKTKVHDLDYQTLTILDHHTPEEMLEDLRRHQAYYVNKCRRLLVREVEALSVVKDKVSIAVGGDYVRMQKKKAESRHRIKISRVLTLADITKTERATRAAQVARVTGMCDYMLAKGMQAAFITITLPSEWHPGAKKENEAWIAAGSPDPIAGAKELGCILDKVARSVRGNRSIEISYIRRIEPHQDGCPHLHAIVFVQPDWMAIAKDIFHQKTEELGCDSRFSQFNLIVPDSGAAVEGEELTDAERLELNMKKACRYLVKDAMGNFDEAGDRLLQEYDPEAGSTVLRDNTKTRAWANTFGIRGIAFSGFSGFAGVADWCFTAGRALFWELRGRDATSKERGSGKAEGYPCNLPLERLACAAYLGDYLTFFRLWAEYKNALQTVKIHKKVERHYLQEVGAKSNGSPPGAEPSVIHQEEDAGTTVGYILDNFFLGLASQSAEDLKQGLPCKPLKSMGYDLAISLQVIIDKLSLKTGLPHLIKTTAVNGKAPRLDKDQCPNFGFDRDAARSSYLELGLDGSKLEDALQDAERANAKKHNLAAEMMNRIRQVVDSPAAAPEIQEDEENPDDYAVFTAKHYQIEKAAAKEAHRLKYRATALAAKALNEAIVNFNVEQSPGAQQLMYDAALAYSATYSLTLSAKDSLRKNELIAMAYFSLGMRDTGMVSRGHYDERLKSDLRKILDAFPRYVVSLAHAELVVGSIGGQVRIDLDKLYDQESKSQESRLDAA